MNSQGSLLEAAVCLAVSGHQVKLLDHLSPRLTCRENQPERHSGRRQEGLGLQLGLGEAPGTSRCPLSVDELRLGEAWSSVAA